MHSAKLRSFYGVAIIIIIILFNLCCHLTSWPRWISKLSMIKKCFLGFHFLCPWLSAWPWPLAPDHDFAQRVRWGVPSLLPFVYPWPQFVHLCQWPFRLTFICPYLLSPTDIVQLHQPFIRFPSSVQLLCHAAGAPDLLCGVWQCAGVFGRVTGACSADHHQLPHCFFGCVGPATGNAGHALGRLPRGKHISFHLKINLRQSP